MNCKVGKAWILLWVALLQLGCTSHTVYAPVSDATIETIPKSGIHKVQKGESLYSIAWRYGLDHRSLAQRNQLSGSYAIHVGQIIYLKGRMPVKKVCVMESPSVPISPRQIKKKISIKSETLPVVPKEMVNKPVIREPTARVCVWRWPAKGPVIAGFSDMNKGINIAGHAGDPIFATAAGRVVYSGHGLRGYGNLIIIEHNRIYLTAYAHNSVLLVKEGQWIKPGQKIAQMGDSGTRRVMLHFEIRREGKPVNPIGYLKG